LTKCIIKAIRVKDGGYELVIRLSKFLLPFDDYLIQNYFAELFEHLYEVVFLPIFSVTLPQMLVDSEFAEFVVLLDGALSSNFLFHFVEEGF
jgi:hypothetical protein